MLRSFTTKRNTWSLLKSLYGKLPNITVSHNATPYDLKSEDENDSWKMNIAESSLYNLTTYSVFLHKFCYKIPRYHVGTSRFFALWKSEAGMSYKESLTHHCTQLTTLCLMSLHGMTASTAYLYITLRYICTSVVFWYIICMAISVK